MQRKKWSIIEVKMKVLEVKQISKKFNKTKIFDNFSLEVNSGEIVAIIGPSGIGKSTLLRCINGLEKIDKGEIIINNTSLKNKISKQSNLDVGLVFQDYNLFPQYSALENITLTLTKVLKLSKEESKLRAQDLLKQMNLDKRKDAYPYELSGGEKQRLAIARTLATNPKIICFDEPTSALDPKLVKQVFKIIKELAKDGKAILIVTHDIKFAREVSDKIVEIKGKQENVYIISKM